MCTATSLSLRCLSPPPPAALPQSLHPPHSSSLQVETVLGISLHECSLSVLHGFPYRGKVGERSSYISTALLFNRPSSLFHCLSMPPQTLAHAQQSWKYVHFTAMSLPPLLFDMDNDQATQTHHTTLSLRMSR